MKKFLVAAAAIAVAIIGFGALGVTNSEATPSGVLVINNNVAAALSASVTDCDSTTVGNQAPPCDLTTVTGRAAVNAVVPLTTLATDSANQISSEPLAGGETIIVQTNDPATGVALNGKGLTCSPVCDNTDQGVPDSDLMKAFVVTAAGSFPDGQTVDATQNSVTVSSSALKLVGSAHNVALALTKPTVQEGATGCGFTSSLSAPTNGAAVAVYTDIAGNALVGYFPTIKSSSTATAVVANGSSPTSAGAASQLVVTQLQADGTTIAGADIYCGVAAGTATISAAPTAAEDTLIGAPANFAQTAALTVTGVPSSIALTASPAAIACDGTATSTVTAKVTDSAGNNVVDGTAVTFSVVALGTANPINTTTTDGSATSVITPLSGSTSGVVVTVTSGSAASSIRIDCSLPVATPTASTGGAAGTPTPRTGVTGPNTGNGGYLGQSGSAGFPMWTLVALALGSVALVAGGMVTRRAGK